MDDETPNLRINVPPDQVAGHYANLVGVWHTQHDFAIDFCVIQPFAGGDEDTMSAQVVSRVRIPPTIVFDLLRSINENMADYEKSFGEIRQPGEDAEEEDEELG